MQSHIDERILVLAASGLCKKVPKDVIKELASCCVWGRAKRGDFVWKNGSEPKFLAVIRSGAVRVTQQSSRGKYVVVELLGKGDCMGLLALLGKRNHPFSAVALANVEFLIVPAQAWRSLCQRYPLLLQNAIREVVPRILTDFGFMAHMAIEDVEARIALALLRMHELLSRETEGGKAIAITRSSLAEIVATSVESAIRVTSRWQKEGIICTGHRSIQILDRRRLQELAGVSSASNALSSSGVFAP